MMPMGFSMVSRAVVLAPPTPYKPTAPRRAPGDEAVFLFFAGAALGIIGFLICNTVLWTCFRGDAALVVRGHVVSYIILVIGLVLNAMGLRYQADIIRAFASESFISFYTLLSIVGLVLAAVAGYRIYVGAPPGRLGTASGILVLAGWTGALGFIGGLLMIIGARRAGEREEVPALMAMEAGFRP